MALKGTLKDFGIADILQLIGQQQKSGTLRLRTHNAEVKLGFKDGNIVKVESAFKKKKELFGAMLVRAELVTATQLEQAIQVQKRTLQRIGDVLVASRVVSRDKLTQMRQLQASETLYGLFAWNSGTYEFEAAAVELDSDAIEPMRADAVLIEGFRRVDEWPLIRKRITNYQMTFERLKALPPKSDFAGLDDGFAGEFESFGDSERAVYELIGGERDVQKLIDLSCLGEFEACKALCKLVNLDYLKPVVVRGRSRAREVGVPAFTHPATGSGRGILTFLVLLLLAVVASRFKLRSSGWVSSPATQYVDPAAQRFISRVQLRRIRAAIEVYQLERGPAPDRLSALVEAGLLGEEDLRYPWQDGYYYRQTMGGGFILLPPLR
jgi:hypothetical protein